MSKENATGTGTTSKDDGAPVSPVPVPTPPVSGANGVNSELMAKLVEYGLDANDTVAAAKLEELGVDALDDLVGLPVEVIQAIGLKPAKAYRLLADLKKPDVAQEAVPQMPVRQPLMMGAMIGGADCLPSIPNDEAWFKNLRTGDILKVSTDSYISAIRAAIAVKIGIYDAPSRLLEEMERFSLNANEQVKGSFWKLNAQLTKRSYAEIFQAIDGVNGRFVTDRRKKELISRVDMYVWPAIAATFERLSTWYELYQTSFGPTAYMGAPVSIPDTSGLRDAGANLRRAINKALAGTGTVVAAAMAYDYLQIKEVLNDDELPAQLGAANREQLFEKIGLDVDPGVIHLEPNIVKYVLGFVEANAQTADKELSYYLQLHSLGSMINWRALGVDIVTVGYKAAPGTKPITSITGNPLGGVRDGQL